MFTLENKDEEEIEASIEMGEEEMMSLKEQENYLQILHNIDTNKCGIFVHALAGVSTPQTLNIVGYVKNKNVTIFIYSSSTHNFIYKILVEHVNCFMFLVTIF